MQLLKGRIAKLVSERIIIALRALENELKGYEVNDITVRVEVGLRGVKGFVQAKLKKTM